MRFLVVYGTTDGMTARIAERLGQRVRSLGHAADVVAAAEREKLCDLRGYGAVLVGASMHVGGYQSAVKRFVHDHLPTLVIQPSAFFSVCLSIASRDPAEREEAWRIARAFPARFGWRPDAIEVFAGALAFSRYGVLRRWAMTRIARRELGGDVDTAHDTVYTDWEGVDRFAARFVELVAGSRSPYAAEAAASTWSAI
jgi:menaquinone-dependent protoporphyrinogen oxidase